MVMGQGKLAARARGGLLLALLCAILALCAGIPDCRQPQLHASAIAMSQMHDCGDGPMQADDDMRAHCMLGYSLRALGPTTKAQRVAYIFRHEIKRSDASLDSTDVEPPVPPPRFA
jgi:hypothetical protein